MWNLVSRQTVARIQNVSITSLHSSPLESHLESTVLKRNKTKLMLTASSKKNSKTFSVVLQTKSTLIVIQVRRSNPSPHRTWLLRAEIHWWSSRWCHWRLGKRAWKSNGRYYRCILTWHSCWVLNKNGLLAFHSVCYVLFTDKRGSSKE